MYQYWNSPITDDNFNVFFRHWYIIYFRQKCKAFTYWQSSILDKAVSVCRAYDWWRCCQRSCRTQQNAERGGVTFPHLPHSKAWLHEAVRRWFFSICGWAEARWAGATLFDSNPLYALVTAVANRRQTGACPAKPTARNFGAESRRIYSKEPESLIG